MSENIVAYIGDCNTGKSTCLYEMFIKAFHMNKKILIIDSATDHVEKSLLKKIINTIDGSYVEIPSCSKEEIIFPKRKLNQYPYEIVEKFHSNIYLCDAAYYLEKGYDFPSGELREKERLFYKKFCMQTIETLINYVDYILMDEIELIPESKRVINEIIEKKITLAMTLHSTTGLCGMEGMFRVERMNSK